jgi:hypothetical protein
VGAGAIDPECENHGGFLGGSVLSCRFAQFSCGRGCVEHVVDHLECEA